MRKKLKQKENWLSRFLSRQTWIITMFAYIGAGYVLAVSYSIFMPEIKLILKQFYVKKTIIIGTSADVSVVKASDSSSAGGNGTNQENTQGGVLPVLSIEDRIRAEAKKVGFDQIDTLVAIAKCESSLKPECEVLNHDSCVNPHNKSFDRGFYQISRKYHPEVTDDCAFNLECSTREAIRIATKSGWSQWACWNLIK